MQLETHVKPSARWVNIGDPAGLNEKGRALVKIEGKAIAVFKSKGDIFACNNRCPHEGFPLIEGVLTRGCLLTCNWHNWKFDLESGETLVGGDRLRRYPIEQRGDEIWIDLAEPPEEELIAHAKSNLIEAMDDFDYARMAREIARLANAGVDHREILTTAIFDVHDRFEFGTTHAFAAAADWVTRSELAEDSLKASVPILEAVAHMSRDALREPRYPFPEDSVTYDPLALARAIEAEDEGQAIGMVRGALASGLGCDDLLPVLAEAALSHYANFGHAAIYVEKTAKLVNQLGKNVEKPLLLALVRALIFGTREDLIPEFRAYGKALDDWDGNGNAPVTGADFHGLSVREALAWALQSSGRREELYSALIDASAWNLLHFDTAHDRRAEGKVDDNVNWLDFTHAITFASAARKLCSIRPDLWPQALLQMACFVGRNKMYVREDEANDQWRVEDADAFFADAYEELNDHGAWRSILACHRLKTLMAVDHELEVYPEAPFGQVMLAGLNRYLHTEMKAKHVMRTMRQAMEFVDQE
jgi:nitrite reductase/ring-hydroxylating ferredoxin subunit